MRCRITLLALVLVVAGVRAALLTRPFTANSESLATGWVLSSARNYVRYNLSASRGAGVLNSGVVPAGDRLIYSHHPPLTPLLSAGVMAVWGVSEWTGRLVPATFSIATTALLFVAVRARFGLRAATVSGVLYAFCPMTLALGDMAEYMNAPMVFFGTAAIVSYVNWFESGRRSWLWTSAGLFVLGASSDWPIFYLVPIFCGHAVITRRSPVRGVLPFIAAGVLIFAAVAIWVRWSWGDVSVFHQLRVRTSAAEISLRGWIGRVIVHHQGMLHTWPVLFLSGMYVLSAARSRATGRLANLDAHALPFLLLVWGITNLLVGIDGNYRHEWWSMVLTPGLAVTAALGVERILQRLPDAATARRWTRLGIAAGLLLFVAWSARTARAFTMNTWLHDDGFTLKGIGGAIHQSSLETEGVLTSVDTDHPALWFYADRQLRPGITSSTALESALGSGPYLLFYRYEQPDGPAPTWFVMPAAHHRKYPDLAAALDARYPKRIVDGSMVYRLRDAARTPDGG